jgi:hypothetical protein
MFLKENSARLRAHEAQPFEISIVCQKVERAQVLFLGEPGPFISNRQQPYIALFTANWS